MSLMPLKPLKPLKSLKSLKSLFLYQPSSKNQPLHTVFLNDLKAFNDLKVLIPAPLSLLYFFTSPLFLYLLSLLYCSI